MTGTRVAIMQPYLFPYLGYWQMMHAVDTFIVYDTVQYTRGWMNRNRYRDGDAARWMTVPIAHGSSRASIRERRLSSDFAEHRDMMLESLSRAYRNAPYRARGLELAEHSLSVGRANGPLLQLLLQSMNAVRELLGITTALRLASDVNHDETLEKEARLISLSKAVGASTYYSLSGGRALYSPDAFAKQGLALRFREFDEELESGTGDLALSIIDLVMRYDLPEIKQLLDSASWSQ